VSDKLPENEYKSLKPYWEAWKVNNQRTSDLQHSEHLDGMEEIFRAVAGQTSVKVNQEALNYVLKSRPHWVAQLKGLSNWDKSTNRVKLYRGVTDRAAISLRKHLRDATPLRELESVPICYTTEIEVARGFARKGHIDGCVYSILAPLDSVLFSDLDGLYREGGGHKEKEVIVWHSSFVEVSIIESNVLPQKPTPRSRAAREKWKLERQALEDKEKKTQSCMG
jgi:hypothetical protein